MSFSNMVLFAGVYLLAVASPGPSVAALVARALSSGFRRTLPFVCGLVVGDLIWLTFTALGLSVLMQNFYGVFLVIKWAGCAYLAYMAYRLITDPVQPLTISVQTNGEGWRLFASALAVTMGNPKVMIFFVSILPLVLDVNSLTLIGFAQVVAMIAVILGASMAAYAYVADRARTLVSNQKSLRWINRITGGVMATAAVSIAARD